jgi:hypothetical protein
MLLRASIRQWRALLVMLGIVAAGVAMILLLSHEDDQRVPRVTGQPSQKNWQTDLVRLGLAELSAGKGVGFAPLGGFYGSRESMPKALRGRIRQNLGGVASLGLRFAQAQHVTSPLRVSFWIVEGKGVTCVFRDGLPASACRTSVLARREGIWLETYSTSQEEVGHPVAFLALGVAPERVRYVAVRSGRVHRLIHPVDHIWAMRSRSPIELQQDSALDKSGEPVTTY